MPGQLLADVQGKNASRRDLSDVITMVDARKTPFTSMVPKGSQLEDNMLMEWPVDKEEEPSENAVVDNDDVQEYDDAMADYGVVQGRLQWMRRAVQVSKLAEKAQNLAGVRDKAKLAKQIAKKMVQLKRDMEIRLCSDGDSQAGSSQIAYKTRGIGEWIKATAQSDLPVPAGYRTPSASINTTATASLAESDVNTVLESVFQEVGAKDVFTGLCGTSFKKRISSFTQTQFGNTNVSSSIRTYNQDLESRRIVATVDVYEGDFGTLELVPTTFNAYLDANGAKQAAVTKARCYVLKMERWKLVHKQKPQRGPILDLGGGERCWIDTILGLQCLSPLDGAKFAATS